MAEIVNRVSHTVKKVARKTSKKAEEIFNVTKYSVKIKAKEVDIEEKLEELGNLYYDYVKKPTEENKFLLDACVAEIDEIKNQIASLRKKIAKAKDEIACTSCGSYVSSSKQTCPKCKATLERMEIKSTESVSEEQENN